MLPTNKIHLGSDNYSEFKEYAGITFEKDNGCDQYTGLTGITVYDNPIASGRVRWAYCSGFGELATTYSVGSDHLHEKLFHANPDSNELGIGKEYFTKQYLTRHGFDRWLNDQLLELEKGE